MPESDSVQVPALALSQPKNYIGVPVAVIASRDTGSLVMGNLTSMAGAAKRGAHAFNLIDSDGDVTDWCRGVLSSILTNYSPLEYLDELKELKNSKGRFVEQRPEWHQFGEAVARQYPATDAIIDILHRTGEVALPELVTHLAQRDAALAEELFLEQGAVPAEQTIGELSLGDSDIYSGTGVCQFKSSLYHLGVLTSAGSSTDYLCPTEQAWALEPTVSAGGWL
jgi:hypothetical protein